MSLLSISFFKVTPSDRVYTGLRGVNYNDGGVSRISSSSRRAFYLYLSPTGASKRAFFYVDRFFILFLNILLSFHGGSYKGFNLLRHNPVDTRNAKAQRVHVIQEPMALHVR